jgi:hypothetical protein
MIRISASVAAVAVLLTLGSAAASATDHLSHANNNPGVDDRGFTNAVNNNPGAGERSPNAGNPAAKPQGFGDPKEGTQTGTPSSSKGIGND